MTVASDDEECAVHSAAMVSSEQEAHRPSYLRRRRRLKPLAHAVCALLKLNRHVWLRSHRDLMEQRRRLQANIDDIAHRNVDHLQLCTEVRIIPFPLNHFSRDCQRQQSPVRGNLTMQ